MDGIGILLQLQHYGWVADKANKSADPFFPSPWLWEELPHHILNFIFPVMERWNEGWKDFHLAETLIFSNSIHCGTVLSSVWGRFGSHPCPALCVCCRCQCSGLWTWWWKPAHAGYLPMPTRITSTPSPSIVTMRRTCLQTTCGSTCGT